jgi:hypothetical protein
MSKTTRKLGAPLYIVYLRCDWNVKPSPSLLRNWARLDHYAMQDYLKPYAALTDVQKIQIHLNLNSGVYKEQEKQERISAKKNQNNQGSVRRDKSSVGA